MRHFRTWALLAISFISTLSCGTAPDLASYGSLDRSLVELLPNGKAKNVDVYSFNDFHGTLVEDIAVSADPALQGKNPGAAKFAESVRILRAMNPNSVFVSAGDSYQGSALSILTKGKIVSEIFREMGVAASAVGNHEFDWGDGHFREWTEDGGFPFLAANLIDKGSGMSPAWIRPYVVLSVGGHRIAFLGLVTTETLASVKRENVESYDFVDPSTSAKAWIKEIRRKDNPEAIIALTHIPATTDRMDAGRVVGPTVSNEIEALSLVRGIDAIVTGHSHASVNGKINGKPVVQAYYNGRSLAKLSFAFKEDGGFALSTSLVEIYKNKSTIAENAAVRGIYNRYMNEYADVLLEEVARVEGDLWHANDKNVTPMGYWVCEALRERFGAQVAVMNGGGLRKGFTEGPVAVQDFWDLMPFDNTAIVFKVSGAVLREIIDHGIDSPGFGNGQFSGLVAQYDPMKAYGGKVASMKLADGTPVRDGGVYTVVTNDFIFLTGGDGYTMMPANDPLSYEETFVPIRDVLMEKAKAEGTIVAQAADVLVMDQD